MTGARDHEPVEVHPSVRCWPTAAPLVLPSGSYRWLPGAALVDLDVLAPRLGSADALAFEVEDEDEPGLWHRGALLRVAGGAWHVVRGGAKPGGVEPSRHDGGLLVALVASPSRLSFDLAGTDWASAPCTPLRGALRPEGASWRGEVVGLSPHDLLRDGLRDWSWVWRDGPSMAIGVRVWLAASIEQELRWLESVGPLPYRADSPTVLGAGERNEHGLHAQQLRVTEGQLDWHRDWREPSEAIRAIDAGLLRALAEGALPVIWWEALDWDYQVPMAEGEGASSLARFCDASADPDSLRAEYARLLAPVSVQVDSPEPRALLGALLRLLGAPREVPPEPEPFARWLSLCPVERVPRCVRLSVPRVAGEDHGWLFTLVTGAQPRMRCTVTER